MYKKYVKTNFGHLPTDLGVYPTVFIFSHELTVGKISVQDDTRHAFSLELGLMENDVT